MEKFQLLYFFHNLVGYALRHPGRPGFGNPCSLLIEDLILYQGNVVDKVLNNDGEFVGYRINGAGLKMYFRIRGGKFQCYISGDQKKDYPEFIEAAEAFIRRRGFNHR